MNYDGRGTPIHVRNYPALCRGTKFKGTKRSVLKAFAVTSAFQEYKKSDGVGCKFLRHLCGMSPQNFIPLFWK
jgi:hypothetical protein